VLPSEGVILSVVAACYALVPSVRALTLVGGIMTAEFIRRGAFKLAATSMVDGTADHAEAVQLSVITPIFNEEKNIPILLDQLFEVLAKVGLPFEIIAVNDGSRDGSLARLRERAALQPELKVLDFRRNYGQTAAVMAGIDHASGDVIISIDADLQNDPRDIPMLLAKLAEGFDVVSGWRVDRKDGELRRNFVSRVANRVISQISGVRLHDYGCTLKAYRSDVIKDVRLYGEMHRFIPIYASWMGAKVVEIPVRHNARRHGRSNYGLERIAKVILDLIVVTFLDRYFTKPIYVFGGFGIVLLLLGAASFLGMIGLKIFKDVSMITTPLPVVTAMAAILGISSILMGLLAEMVVRTYFESQQRAHYLVRERINFIKSAD
jgi:glycosyltransferase involved in cell wall biosynthesis